MIEPAKRPRDSPATASSSAHAHPSVIRYGVLAMLCAAAMVAYISRNSLSVPTDLIKAELNLTETQMGWVMSAFFWSYAFAQIPAGWFGQWWGTRRALSLYALVWSAASLISGVAAGFWSLIVARLLFGVAQAGIFPCSANTIALWLPKSFRGTASGSLGGFMSIGGAISLALTGLLLSGMDTGIFTLAPMGWRSVFSVFAIPGVVWAIVFFFWFRDRPEQHSRVNSAELTLIRGGESASNDESVNPVGRTSAAGSVPWGIVFSSPSMWMICGQQFCRAAGYVFFVTWFPKYLQEVHNVTIANSGFLGSLPLCAAVGGSFCGGGLVDYIWVRTGSKRMSRQGVAIAAMLGCAALTILASQVRDLNIAVALLTLGTFIATMGGSCGYTVTIDKGGEHVGPIFGMMNMAGNFGAASLPVAVGMLFDQQMFNASLILVAMIYVVAAACWMLLNPEGTLFSETDSDGRDLPEKNSGNE